MSDASQKGSTAPMGAAPPARAATQVSAAVPAPQAASTPHGGPDEISGTLVVHGPPSAEPTPSQPAGQRAAAATKMSAAVDPNAFGAAAPNPRPEDADTFAAPAPIVDRAAHARGGTFETGHPGLAR